MSPASDNPLSTARRDLRVQRWTAVLTTAGTGVVLVAFAARLGTPAAVAAAVFAAAALAMAVWRAANGDRPWRRASAAVRTPSIRGSEER